MLALTRHKHKQKCRSKEVILKLACAVRSLIEKPFSHRASFSKLYDVTDKLVESVAKYVGYLQENQQLVNNYQSLEDPGEITNIVALPYLPRKAIATLYPSMHDRDFAETLEDQLAFTELYTTVNIDQYFVRNKAHRYLFLKNLKSSGLLTSNVILFTRYYGSANTDFLWKKIPLSQRI